MTMFYPPITETDPSFPIWNVVSVTYPPLLYKIDDQHYQVTVAREFGHLIDHTLFTIIHESVLLLFQQHKVQLHSYTPVSIYDKPNDRYIPGYYKIAADTITSPLDLEQIDHSGHKAWIDIRTGGLFVSLLLKEAMKATELKVFFVEGYSFYVG